MFVFPEVTPESCGKGPNRQFFALKGSLRLNYLKESLSRILTRAARPGLKS